MQKSKQKQIKKLKKIHILPHFIILTIFIVFLVVIIAAVSELFFTFMLDNRLENSFQRAELVAKWVEKNSKEQDDTILVDTSKWATDEFGIFDNEKKDFVVKPSRDAELSEYVTYEMENHRVLLDQVEDKGMQQLMDDDVNGSEFIKHFMKEADQKLTMDAVAMNEELFNLHGWIDVPIMEGRYSVYYSTDVRIKAKDILYTIIFIGILIAVVSVPLLLYIITLIISVLGQARTAKLLYFDTVTGGKNWLYFKDRAEHIVKRNKRGKRRYAMVSLRMDRYQSYCACYGTQEGEELIDRMNQVLVREVKKNKEAYARYAEAEFGLLLMMEDPAQMTQRVNEIKNQLVQCIMPRKIDFTIGLCEAIYGNPIDEIYSNASLARKSIPQGATEKSHWFNEKLKEEQLWERYVEENMERALAEGELHVYIQPKYNAGTKRLGGAEALIRWISPTEGFIGPGKFIPIFEKNGFITKIDDFMLSSVAKLQAKWYQEGRNVVPISVNISRAHFTQEDLAEHICKIVEDSGAPKELIELELTESAFFEDKDILINTVEKLKSMGFSISMDDFGAGYSSLNSLKDLRLDVLKIDADFFRGKQENEERGSLIVSETIQLAKNLGMTTVAEGIESAEQVDFLAENGCDLIQGFYFAKPMPVADYEMRMEEDSKKGEKKDVNGN